MRNPIFITGGTGYIGKRLINLLLQEGYPVKALVRKGSEKKLPPAVPFLLPTLLILLLLLMKFRAIQRSFNYWGYHIPGQKRKCYFIQ